MNNFLRKVPGLGGESKYWLSLPPQRSILSIKNLRSSAEIHLDRQLGTLEYITGQNVNILRDPEHQDGFLIEPAPRRKGEVLFSLRPHVFRGKIDPSKVRPEEKTHAEYLKDEGDLDINSPIVRKVAREILNSLAAEKRNNPYWKAFAAFEWAKENIAYSVVPRREIHRIAQTIQALPEPRKNDPYSILRESCDFASEDLLRKISAQATFPPELTGPLEKAWWLMEKADSISGVFQLTWGFENPFSASRAIQEKMAKCVGIANAFAALCRALGIPSKTVSGLWGKGREFSTNHSWTLVYLPPYGWVESDPTISPTLEGFSFSDYSYDFIFIGGSPRCEVTLLPEIQADP